MKKLIKTNKNRQKTFQKPVFFFVFLKKWLKNLKKWAPGAPGKKNWPPDKNSANGRAGGGRIFIRGPIFFSGGPGAPGFYINLYKNLVKTYKNL